MEAAPQAPEPPPPPEVAPPEPCGSPIATWSGNRWWGEITSCDGDDAELVLRVDSGDLGFGMYAHIGTSECPYGSSYWRLDDPAFFDWTLDRQRQYVERQVMELVPVTFRGCTGDFQPGNRAYFHAQFRETFAEIAERYWRDEDKGVLRRQMAESQETQR